MWKAKTKIVHSKSSASKKKISFFKTTIPFFWKETRGIICEQIQLSFAAMLNLPLTSSVKSSIETSAPLVWTRSGSGRVFFMFKYCTNMFASLSSRNRNARHIASRPSASQNEKFWMLVYQVKKCHTTSLTNSFRIFKIIYNLKLYGDTSRDDNICGRIYFRMLTSLKL